ncbi:DUF4424 domain-containing protein [Novosphingobium terrae]|uniref:DUF4424 domain-containing protein n=1 Tax=Novosphingobium terrae TaxID=2726189 RepID=UPI00197F727B|nr:DUF4424 domain-containing protein [Novosphingobium terrae]
MKAHALLIAATLLAGLPGVASANDSSAQLAAGGLVLTRSDAIEMRSEDLRISRSEVVVRYTFLNTSGKDVTSRVAFPLPPIGGPYFFESDVSIPVSDSDNFLGFTTRVDGKPVTMEMEQKAMTGTVDRTAWLRSNGIPLTPESEVAGGALDRLSAARHAEAVRLKLIEENGDPSWSLHTTYHWVQRFPAGVPVVVEHRYKPSVGGTVMTMLGEEKDPETEKRYCVEPSLLAGLRRTAKAGRVVYSENWLDYILVTGGNWKAPIGQFKLTVDKEQPGDLVSFCGDGVRKISPTRFEVTHTNWRPTQNLSILFLVRNERTQ